MINKLRSFIDMASTNVEDHVIVKEGSRIVSWCTLDKLASDKLGRYEIQMCRGIAALSNQEGFLHVKWARIEPGNAAAIDITTGHSYSVRARDILEKAYKTVFGLTELAK